MVKLLLLKSLMSLMLLVLPACGRADISEIRKNFILANDHGWVELTVDISPELVNQTKQNCMLDATVNGERFLSEALYSSGNPEKSIKTGFLFAIPSAKNEVVLNFSLCQKETLQTRVPLELPMDTIVHLKFDGKTITASAPAPYQPITLATLAEKIMAVETSQKLNQVNVASDLSLMFKVLAVAVVLIGAMLIVSLLRHGKK